VWQRFRRRHLDQRDVSVRIGSDPLCTKAATIRQPHRDPIGAFDHVMVGQDVAIGIDDESCPGSATWSLTLSLRCAAEEVGAIRQRNPGALTRTAARARRCIDVDDRRIQLLGDIRKRRRSRPRGRQLRRT
jgi:hypothetical protein